MSNELIATKICSVCKIEKNTENFGLRSDRKIGIRSQCKICDKAYKVANFDKILKNREDNKELLSIAKKQYYEDNKAKILEKQTLYSQTPMGKAVKKNTCNKRRAIKKAGDVSTTQLLELEQNAKQCYWCNNKLKPKQIHIDHYIPLSKGGRHTISNLVVSCSSCNITKGAIDPMLFANSVGRLL